MIGKNEIYELLKNNNVRHEITEHCAVFNMKELERIDLPYADCDAKNLFVKAQNGKGFYLITVKGNKKADLNAFRKSNGIPRLSFATPDELYDILSLIPGSVGPFGLLNDAERKVVFYIDKQLFEGKGIVGVHPNDNTATVWIKTVDLVELIRGHGNACFVVDIPTVE